MPAKGDKLDPFVKINKLYNRCLLALGREVEQLVSLGDGEKLSPAHAKDLRDYSRLLGDMKEAYDKLAAEKANQAKVATKAVPDEALMQAVTGAGG